MDETICGTSTKMLWSVVLEEAVTLSDLHLPFLKIQIKREIGFPFFFSLFFFFLFSFFFEYNGNRL